MWHDHPCSQRNKVTKRAMEMVGGDEEGGGGDFGKRMVGSIGGSS